MEQQPGYRRTTVNGQASNGNAQAGGARGGEGVREGAVSGRNVLSAGGVKKLGSRTSWVTANQSVSRGTEAIEMSDAHARKGREQSS